MGLFLFIPMVHNLGVNKAEQLKKLEAEISVDKSLPLLESNLVFGGQFLAGASHKNLSSVAGGGKEICSARHLDSRQSKL